MSFEKKKHANKIETKISIRTTKLTKQNKTEKTSAVALHAEKKIKKFLIKNYESPFPSEHTRTQNFSRPPNDAIRDNK